MNDGRVLVVDDKDTMLRLFERLLGDRYEVVAVADGETALARAAEGDFDVVISDIRMPGADGLQVLRHAKLVSPHTEVILMTAYATVQSAIDAMRAGAYDYLPKPFDPDQAVLKVARAVEHKRLRDHVEQLARQIRDRYSFEQLIGRSPAMQKVFALLRKAADLELTVLLTGESGTGKELAARAVHFAHARREEPFIAVNCGAFPQDLMESELFGHVRGAFTGADRDKVGLIEEAGAGTLFLDEVGDLPLPLQVKLNRALQEREFRRVGDTRTRRVAARILAATNVDLEAKVAEGSFREDLFYRLNVFPIRLPPLRERAEDVPLLAAHLLSLARERSERGARGFAPDAVRALTSYGWPGNVRELQNAIERAAAVAEGPEISAADLPADLIEPQGRASTAVDGLVRLPYQEAISLLHDRATREYLASLMRSTGGNVSKAAEQAELARESLHRLLRRHGVDPDDYRR